MTQGFPPVLLAGLAVVALLAATLVLVLVWRLRARLLAWLGLPGLEREAPALAALALLVLLLAPLWLALLVRVGLGALGLALQPLAALDPAARALQSGALLASLAGLAALVALPLWLARLVMAEARATDAARAEAARADIAFADRFASAIAQLGATRRLSRRVFLPEWQRLPGGRIRRDELGAPLPETDAEGQLLGEWRLQEEIVPDIEARIGALYALERISRASPADHIPVMETIAAYVRENAGLRHPGETRGPGEVRADIQTALQVLGRRPPEARAAEAAARPPFRLDLRGVDLAGADLVGLALGPARMGRADLSGAWLDGADLSGADLEAAVLSGAWLEGARLIGAQLRDADLSDAWMVRADLRDACLASADLAGARLAEARLAGAELEGALPGGTDLRGADLTLAWLRGVDCAGFEGLEEAQLAAAIGDATTELPEGLARPAGWSRETLDYMTAFRLWTEAVRRGGAIPPAEAAAPATAPATQA
ncbi:MAG: pentapeptide repeat-containing protein [Rhodobacteraceae bacterium]|nr:pentapeptide repeat-containing protein [Paracoccaceae bacterium]